MVQRRVELNPWEFFCLALRSRDWGMDYGVYYWGLYMDYYRDPFPPY